MTRPRADEEPRDPVDVALRLAKIVPEPNALIGALAVSAHGYVRATDEVDFISSADPVEIQARLEAARIPSSIRRGDSLKGGIRSAVYGTADGIRFDILFPPVAVDWSRTVALPIEERQPPLRVVDLGTLIRLKLRAGGPQDLIDVVQLVRRHPAEQRAAADIAQAYGLRKTFDDWLADPRIRSPEEPPPLLPLPEKPTAKPPRAARTSRRTARR